MDICKVTLSKARLCTFYALRTFLLFCNETWQSFQGVFQHKRLTLMLENFLKYQMRRNAYSVANHNKAFSVLRCTIVLCFQKSIVKLVFFTKIFLKILFDFFYLVHHTFYILHYKELRAYIPKENQILLIQGVSRII